MLATSDLIAFVPASDLDRARAFYQGTLGLRLESDSPFACVFDVGGTMLRVAKVDEPVAAPYTVLGWRVSDIREVMEGLSQAGVRFLEYPGMNQDPAGVWTTPGGDQVAWFTDLDGNTLSLTQFA
jgi:catechol 2,3-dioxygenase-like lactoylglutathione lyase family enzyme